MLQNFCPFNAGDLTEVLSGVDGDNHLYENGEAILLPPGTPVIVIRPGIFIEVLSPQGLGYIIFDALGPL